MASRMRWWLGFAFLACATEALADDCPNCHDSLCTEHDAEDQKELAIFLTDKLSPSAENRLSALKRYEAACRKHLNCRMPTSARHIGGLLGDPEQQIRMLTVEVLRETQNQHTAAEVAVSHARRLRMALERRPTTKAEHAVWDADFEFFKQVARLLGDSGVLEASRGIVDLLQSTSFDLLEVAANNCSRIRTHEVATAVLEAYGRARGLDPKAGKVSVVLLQAWNMITKSEIRAPKGANKEDFDRFMAACKAWLKANPGDPEGWLK